MRIITLIKAIPDLSNISISKSQQKIFENNPPILNPVDENALELSLTFKDSQKAEVVVVSFTQPSNEKILHQALAMGADRAYLINDPNFLGEDHFLKACVLAEAIKKIGNFNLIISGSGSITGNGGQAGPRVAEYLNLPQFTQVKSLQLIENKIFTEKFPCLLTVALGINKPRIPNALAVMKAGKKEIIKLNIQDLNLEPSIKKTSEVVRTYLP